ncbi:MAG: hypothetical protein JNJ60_16735 [Rhodocyclaceae bacterium]|nr:hypothetical protein [Rhodocyclaceae bacterium]
MQDPLQIAIASFLATSRQALFGHLRETRIGRIAVVPRRFVPKRLFAGLGYQLGKLKPMPLRRQAAGS